MDLLETLETAGVVGRAAQARETVTFKLNHEITWPINFKLLPLTVLASPRLAEL